MSIKQRLIPTILLTAAVCISGCGVTHTAAKQSSPNPPKPSESAPQYTTPTSAKVKTTVLKNTTSSSPPSHPAPTPEPIWGKPTGGAYPVLAKGESTWIHVSVSKQRVYIMHDDQVLYTMIASTGLDTVPDNSTPEGTFHIQKERGTSFYFPPEKEGAKYWVSWKNHGEFLFHSVPTDQKGNIIVSEAKKLGQKASHGCVRLSVPDAKWIYENIPVNTKVVIGK